MLSLVTTTPEYQEFIVNIIQEGHQLAGENYMLLCSTLPNFNMTTFEWFYQQDELTDPKTRISTSSHLEVIDWLFASELVLSPLHESHTGLYTCQASLGSDVNESSHVINVESMYLDLI